MTPEEREVMELALEALEDAQYFIEAELNDRMDLYKNYTNLAHKYAGEQESLRKNQEAINAIKAALEAHKALSSPNGEAQPAVAEQHKQMSVSEVEPVAWMEGESVYWHTNPSLNDWIRANGTPLYTTPPQRPSRSDIKPLTDTERDSMVDSYDSGLMEKFWYLKGIDDTEAAHGIRPTDFKE